MSAFSFDLSDFVFVWWGLLYEAMPFVVLGTLLSGFVERCVSRETVVKLFPKNRFLGIGVSACLGLVFPMCECGIVPVVRRLVLKGVPVSCGVAYMLASPIINPLVMLSTVIAFRGRSPFVVTGLRVGMGYVVAVALGVVVWKLLGEKEVLLPQMQTANDAPPSEQKHRGTVLGDTLLLAAEDFMEICATLVVGAALAAFVNSSFSRASMEPFARNPFSAVFGMSALAIGLNLCSEADAFVASSFYAFPLAAKMAFLVLGPMVDVKLLAMYTTVFRPKAIIAISGITTVVIGILCITGYVWMPTVSTVVLR